MKLNKVIISTVVSVCKAKGGLSKIVYYSSYANTKGLETNDIGRNAQQYQIAVCFMHMHIYHVLLMLLIMLILNTFMVLRRP